MVQLCVVTRTTYLVTYDPRLEHVVEHKQTSLHLMPVWVPLHKELGVRVVLYSLVNWGHILFQTDHLHFQNTGLCIVPNSGPLKGAAILINQTRSTQRVKETGRRREIEKD